MTIDQMSEPRQRTGGRAVCHTAFRGNWSYIIKCGIPRLAGSNRCRDSQFTTLTRRTLHFAGSDCVSTLNARSHNGFAIIWFARAQDSLVLSALFLDAFPYRRADSPLGVGGERRQRKTTIPKLVIIISPLRGWD